MSRSSKQLVQIILLFAVMSMGALAIFLGFRAINNDTSVDDSSAAENNCCTLPGCPNYNGDWVAGYNACLRGECTQCAGGQVACNQNKICQSGENEGNCPSDCDNAGYSQLDTEGVVCDPGQTDRGFGQCKESSGFACVTCPNTSVNSSNSFCTTRYRGSYPNYTPNQRFIDELCGGLINEEEDNCGNGTIDSGEQCDPVGSSCSVGNKSGTCSSSCSCLISTAGTPAPTPTPTNTPLPSTAISSTFAPVTIGALLILFGFYVYFRSRWIKHP